MLLIELHTHNKNYYKKQDVHDLKNIYNRKNKNNKKYIINLSKIIIA